MPHRTSRRSRRLLPGGLAGLAGITCAACCVVPILLAAGVLSGAGWAALDAALPGIAIALAAAAGLAWSWNRRRTHHAHTCTTTSGGSCSCAKTPAENDLRATSLPSRS
jgi:hypothetical protein